MRRSILHIPIINMMKFNSIGRDISCRYQSTVGNFEFILAEKRGRVGLIQLNRPKALNALCEGLRQEVLSAGRSFDRDPNVGAIVITGNEKAFAAGADIKEMANMNFPETYLKNNTSLTDIGSLTKPVIAAVAGYCLGGGCELALLCDIIIAGENAKFGQPEINLSVIPGGGATQRLIRIIGKSKAMEMVLTARHMDAFEAERTGLAAKVVPTDQLLTEALKLGEKIASFSNPAIAMAKETVKASENLPLEEGLRFERRIFHSMFALHDQKEGMKAFIEKRKADWKHQ